MTARPWAGVFRLHAYDKAAGVFLDFACDRVRGVYEALDEFDKETWNLRVLGLRVGSTGTWLHSEDIPQEWLRVLAKRWIRLYLPIRSAGSVVLKLKALRVFAGWLADIDPDSR